MSRLQAPIGLDLRYLSHRLLGGVHTYVQNLTQALFAVAPERDYRLYADTKAPFELTALPATAQLRLLPWSNAASSARHDLALGRQMARDGVGVAHFPANYGFTPASLPTVITLHDAINLLPLRQLWRSHGRDPRTLLTMTYLHALTVAATRRGPTIVTCSEYSRREILRRTRLAPARVHTIYEAPDPAFRCLDDATLAPRRASLTLRQHVLLADAIKNPACTLRAYRALDPALREQTSLVFFARRPPDEVVRLAAEAGECRLLLRPTLDELVQLYNLADLFLFPSWYEGFGLPVLEAMACGTPVIASSRGALPEVVGPGGRTIDADDAAALAAAATSLLTDSAQYHALREQALAHAARFTWQAAARQTLAVYDAASRRGPGARP